MDVAGLSLVSSEVRTGPDTNSTLSSRQLQPLIPGIRAHGHCFESHDYQNQSHTNTNFECSGPVTRPKLNVRLSTGALVQDLPGLI